ncbi:MAG: NADH:flavin oxidoreductase [Nitriliruptorales bacterium]|nr:NADH:flavin oxidoreductase [Nitriliruptorales bacterium]
MLQLFEEASLGPLTLRNRVIKAATFEGRSRDGLALPALADFHRQIAAGGVGMSTVAYLAVAPEGRTDSANVLLRPEAIAGLRRVTDAIHEEGALAAAQIGHAGPVANAASNRAKSVTPTRMFSPLGLRFSRAATEEDLERITADYRQGARVAVESGFDALEIHLGHNYLLSAFLSPLLNRRKDRWGGVLENRARFPRQIVAAVRDAVGTSVAVTAKLNMTDGIRGGLSVDDSLAFARMLQVDGHLDALELTGGSSLMNPMFLFRGAAPYREFRATLPWYLRFGFRLAARKFLREYPYEEAFFKDTAARFRDELDLPVILLGGISRLDTAEEAIADGFAFVAMGRALLHDPDLVNQWQMGTATASGCIHCNRCMPTIYTGTRCPLVDPRPGDLPIIGVPAA